MFNDRHKYDVKTYLQPIRMLALFYRIYKLCIGTRQVKVSLGEIHLTKNLIALVAGRAKFDGLDISKKKKKNFQLFGHWVSQVLLGEIHLIGNRELCP